MGLTLRLAHYMTAVIICLPRWASWCENDIGPQGPSHSCSDETVTWGVTMACVASRTYDEQAMQSDVSVKDLGRACRPLEGRSSG
ncbi:hypothetical protein F4780DRAFT_170059 [Xylariomycetidae sp. FL0641]|nr:hypothetical protein F4780DRAFT_170059 [Xylariomycetidae sp. FL0641]